MKHSWTWYLNEAREALEEGAILARLRGYDNFPSPTESEIRWFAICRKADDVKVEMSFR